jgi:hypothetical protein
MSTTLPSTAKAQSTPVPASSWIARPWPIGWARARPCCSLGRRHHPARQSGRSAACRRHAGAGARPGTPANQDGPIMGAGQGRATMGRPGAAGRHLSLFARSQRRARAGAARRLQGLPARRRLCRLQQALRAGRTLAAHRGACWAHARRKLYDVHAATNSPLAREALERIGQLFAIEAEIKGQDPAHRHRGPPERSLPKLDELRASSSNPSPRSARRAAWPAPSATASPAGRRSAASPPTAASR